MFLGLTFGAVSIGMAVSAPLVALFGIRGALFAAGAASIVAACVALGLRLHRLRGEPVRDLGVAVAHPR